MSDFLFKKGSTWETKAAFVKAGSTWVPLNAPASQIGSEWVLDFEDYFSGSSLNTAYWNVTDWSSPASNNSAVWRASNVVVTGGNLRILSKEESFGSYSWTSGNIQSYSSNKYMTPRNYFRAEVRFRAPHQVGFWPAPLWFRPIKDGAVVDGEIDLYEGWGIQRPNFLVKATLHGPYASPHAQIERHISWTGIPNPDPSDWHTAIIEKTPGQIKCWMDGVLFATFNGTQSQGNWTPSHWTSFMEDTEYQWSPRITMQIGLPSAGEDPDNTVDWSPDASTMFIDYVKIWDYRP